MTTPAPVRSIVLRIRFETVLLIAGATGLAFGISHEAHRRATQPATAATEPQPAWTGRIADVSASTPEANSGTMTSASLVVAPSTLALPSAQTRPTARPHPCEQASCASKAGLAAVPQRHRPPPATQTAGLSDSRNAGFFSKLNPLKHIPEVVKHPFEIAGNTITGWFNRP